MRILAMEGYYGGSHRAFLDGWIRHSQHHWDVLTLPPNKWKWRMRHGAFTLAGQVNRQVAAGQSWDVLFCTDMLNLAEFRGLVAESIRRLPMVVYFHENQLTYPVRVEDERDYQYAITNFTTALAADAVWFNSAFHRDEFLDALAKLFNRMPDYKPNERLEALGGKISIQPLGIESFAERPHRRPGPPRILWAARWEHDKNPEDFFAAVERLVNSGLEFRMSVIGEQFRDVRRSSRRPKYSLPTASTAGATSPRDKRMPTRWPRPISLSRPPTTNFSASASSKPLPPAPIRSCRDGWPIRKSLPTSKPASPASFSTTAPSNTWQKPSKPSSLAPPKTPCGTIAPTAA